MAEAKAPTNVACCYGCGAPLQTVELDAPGYVDLETYELVGFSCTLVVKVLILLSYVCLWLLEI